MPDLKSELMKLPSLDALKFDDEPETKPEVQVVDAKPMSDRERLWNVLHSNPSSSVRELRAATDGDMENIHAQLRGLEAKGLAVRAEHNGILYFTAVGDEYPKFDRSTHMKTMLESKRIALPKGGRRKKQEAVAKAKPRPDSPVAGFDPSALLATLNILQARALYDELKKIFGG
jgi:hypothetical protein